MKNILEILEIPPLELYYIFFRYVTGVLLYLAIHRIRTREFEVEGDIMMIVAVMAVAFNVVLGLLLHGVCQIPHSHSHHFHYFLGMLLEFCYI